MDKTEMSEQEKREWFESLEKAPNADRIDVRICDFCEKTFTDYYLNFHYPHRKQDAVQSGDQPNGIDKKHCLFLETPFGAVSGYVQHPSTESPSPILKLRFVLLESAIVCEVLQAKWPVLKNTSYRKNNRPLVSFGGDYTMLGQGFLEFGKEVVSAMTRFDDVQAMFELYKSALTSFAESLQGEKPVPRIEKSLTSATVFYKDGVGAVRSCVADIGALKAVAYMATYPFADLLYEPKSKGIWTREMPREFNEADFDLPTGWNPINSDDCEQVLEHLNKLNNSPISSYIFEIYE